MVSAVVNVFVDVLVVFVVNVIVDVVVVFGALVSRIAISSSTQL